jgi:acyl carrier protein
MAVMQQRLERVFQEVFDDDQLQITDATSPENTEEWDSLAQVKLIVALEEEFKIKFTTDEVASLSTVGEFKEALAEKGIQ